MMQKYLSQVLFFTATKLLTEHVYAHEYEPHISSPDLTFISWSAKRSHSNAQQIHGQSLYTTSVHKFNLYFLRIMITYEAESGLQNLIH